MGFSFGCAPYYAGASIVIEMEASVKTKEFVMAMSVAVFLAGCASAGYKPRAEGFTNFGYEETKVRKKCVNRRTFRQALK